MKSNKCLWFTLLVLFYSCGSSTTKKSIFENKIIVDIDNADQKKSLYFSDLFTDYKVVALETKEECLIGKIDHVRSYKDKFYILDSKIGRGIFVFNKNGDFINKIGVEGKGIGEYIKLDDFSIDCRNDQIAVLSKVFRKIIFYSLEGEYLKEIGIDIPNAKYIEIWNDKIYIDALPSKGKVTKYLLYAYDLNGKMDGAFLSNKKLRNEFCQPLIRSRSFSLFDGHLMYYKTLVNDIYIFSKDGPSPYLELKTKNVFTSKEIEHFNNYPRTRGFMKDFFKRTKKFTGIYSLIESEKFFYAKYKNNRVASHLFYYKESDEYVITNRIIDDLTNISWPEFSFSCENYMVQILEGRKMNKFIKNNNDKNIEDLSDHTISLDSNPILIFYKNK